MIQYGHLWFHTQYSDAGYVMEEIKNKTMKYNRIKIFRLYYYIALTQLLMYFIVPLLIFPGKIIKDIEIVSALSFGTLVGIFFGLVNMIGYVLDKSRRTLYIIMISLMVMYLAWATISWLYIEHMEYILR